MKKIVFGITALNIGGAERVLVNLANELSKYYQITIFTIYGNNILEPDLNKNIKVINMINKSYNELSFVRRKIMGLLFKLDFTRKIIYTKYIKGKYNVYISFLEGPITELFKYKDSNKKIAFVHTDITSHYKDNKNIVKTYNCYDDVVFVSKDIKEKFVKKYDLKTKSHVIYNYVNYNEIIEKSKFPINNPFSGDGPNFLIVCRLEKPKALDRLIKVHKSLIDDKIVHNIYVVGEGTERENLENLIKENKVSESFILLGEKTNPYPYMKLCDCFMLVSYYEGYGVVLREAMILNKYIMITDLASKEVIKDYESSLIVTNDEKGIYEGIKKLVNNKKELYNDFNYEHKCDNIISEIRELL